MATLVGVDDETGYTTSAGWNADTVYGFENGTTASATGTADTAHIYVRTAWSTGDIKILVYDSNKDLVASSAAITKSGQSDQWLTASITASITSGNTYYLCGVASSGATHMYSDGSSSTVPYDTSGSYASPPDPLGTTTTSLGLYGPIYLSGSTSGSVPPLAGRHLQNLMGQ